MLELNKIHQGDCLELMKDMPDESVDLTVTSPPYDNLRDYKGYSFDFKRIANELYRITKSGAVVVWVVGDSTVKGSETLTSFKQAIYFNEIGFNIHDTMIYKKNKVPVYDPRQHRYKNNFEYMFIFSKGKPKSFNPIKDVPVKSVGKITKVQQRLKDGTFRRDRTIKLGESQARGAIWEYVTGVEEKIAYKHPAVFPGKLAEDHIISWSNPGEIVFDPMAGAGTTCKMAMLNNRQYLGMEISKEYVDIANERINQSQLKFEMR